MIHVYKAGGEWVDPKGREYTIKCINLEDEPAYLAEGWVRTFDECFPEEVTEPTKEELIAALEEAGIDYDKRWGVEKLKEALGG